MLIIRLKKVWVAKVAAIGFLSVFVCSIGLNIYHHHQNIKISDEYVSMSCMVKEFGKSNLVTFLSAQNRMEQRYKNIEIFDIEKEAVVKKVLSNASIQEEVESYLRGITGMYVKANAFPDKGYIVRVPFDPPIKIKNPWLKQDKIDTVSEAFILFPREESPYVLVLDQKKRPFFYDFKGNASVLLKSLSMAQPLEFSN